MRRFADLYDALDATTSTNAKVAAMRAYFAQAPPADAAWAVFFLTGARLKIGYQAALKMLRAGARVLVSTRFPHDAARRYAAEPDFAEWSGRLRVHGLDLRHSPSVEIFARFLAKTEDRLDILVNNAAQTVRRPVGFYAHLLEREAMPWTSLTGGERDRSQVIREAILAAWRARRDEQLRAEAEAVAADADDQAEARAVLADMESLRAW